MSDKMAVETRSRQGLRLEQAARAAWLYYVGRRTQDEVASQLNISRQAAQRLISLALTEKLIKFRFDHEVGPCMEAGDALSRRFGLALCEVVPTMGNNSATLGSVAIAGAQFLEKWLSQRAPLVLGLGTGRTLRAIANELSPIAAPQHKVFSLCGSILPMGRAIALDPVLRIAERSGAQCYSLPSPVIAATVEERDVLKKQQPYETLSDLLPQARCMLVGVGSVDWKSALHSDGCVSDLELTALIEGGAVGEIGGWSYDAEGKLRTGERARRRRLASGARHRCSPRGRSLRRQQGGRHPRRHDRRHDRRADHRRGNGRSAPRHMTGGQCLGKAT
jgi:DNA-binding transcriptional regulator LsrR (DeoR family)